MSSNQPRKIIRWLLLTLILGGVFALILGYIVLFEKEEPTIALALESHIFGAERSFDVTVQDPRSGLKTMTVFVVRDNQEIPILEKDFEIAGTFKRGVHTQSAVTVTLSPESLKLSDGPALLKVVASDCSWKNWGKGNEVSVERDIEIDTTVPEITVLSEKHYVAQGGTGLVIYRLSEPCDNHGVSVGGHLFPGRSGYVTDSTVYLAFFALDYTQGPGTELFIDATDRAGNNRRAGFYHHINKRSFRKDTLNVSDGFLQKKMPEFKVQVAADSTNPLLDKYLIVNRDMRRDNYESLVQVTKNSRSELSWDGSFMSMKNAATRARFADHRTYKYKGKTVDKQIHLGLDFASLAHADVPAANGGVVVFVDYLGIYGKSVLIDHGFGLFSVYSHLSSFAVASGQKVDKGTIVGKTGTTGLAGGDHLHFSIMVNDTFVNPVEWLDGTWVKNNVTSKLSALKDSLAL